ncbi:MAG: molybdenum ABC transporter ATP-binding protein [Pseudomonadales bacterium]
MISADIHITRPGGFTLDVQLHLGDGVSALYGPSGAGKTSILRLLAGLERGTGDDTINIRADDVEWQGRRGFVPSYQRKIGYVFQRPQLFPHLNVEKNLAYAIKRVRSDQAPALAQVQEWLDLSELLDKRVDQLSGGEGQRVAIGRALLSGARYLLLDEPLGSVDQAARWRILPYLARLHRELDVPMIYVSHSLDEVNYLADVVYMIESGRVAAAGSVFETSASLEFNKNESDSLAAVVHCKAVNYDAAFGLAEFSLGRQSLYVASDGPITGSGYRVRIPARDVSITLVKPENTSILNIMVATVDDMEEPVPLTGASVLVRLAVDDQFILARITRKSLSHLGLRKGLEVYVQIKGVALLTDNVS